jgi:hypothetical protein
MRVKYFRIANIHQDRPGDVWVHPDAIESVEAADNGQTAIGLRSGRPLLVDQRLEVVLEELGHSEG